MASHRQEQDALGTVNVPAGRLWGAQTERARLHFHISTERMPLALIHALASVKLASAQINAELGLLPTDKAQAIVDVHCTQGIEANPARIREHLERSLMLVTALVPHIGCDQAARMARLAFERDVSLREAALCLGYAPSEQLDAWLQPASMLGPQSLWPRREG